MTPSEILEHIEAADETVTQSDLVAAAGVSKATISRTLASLEDNGQVVRIMLRGRNNVYLADELPEAITP